MLSFSWAADDHRNGTPYSIATEICNNDLDDDGDGLADCDDSDCPCYAGELEFCTYNLTLNYGETFNIRDFVHRKNSSLPIDWSQVHFTYTAAGANDPVNPADWHLSDFNNGLDVTILSSDDGPGTGNSGDGEYRIYLVRNGQSQYDDHMTIRVENGNSNSAESICPSEICNNGIDDDGDGLIDGADPDCSSNCTAPIFNFQNPVLLSGTAGAVGAVYLYSTILPGIDARVAIQSRTHSDIVIQSLDEPAATNGGYDGAFQPIIDYNWLNSDGGYDASGEKSVTFKFDFLQAGTSNPQGIPQLNMTALDIDGSGTEIREFAETSGFSSYELQTPTSLTLSGGLKAKGAAPAFNGVVETELTAMISFVFNGASTVTVTYGADWNGTPINGQIEEARMNSLYFKCYSFNTAVTCPTVSITGGNQTSCGSLSAALNATTDNGLGVCNLQWQSSTDNVNWTNIAGATGTSYTTPIVSTTTYFRASYSCSDNFYCGTIYSNVAVLTITGPCPEICDNGLDDDGDGLTDCADPDCTTTAGYATAVTSQTGVSNPSNALGAPNGTFAQLYETGDRLVLDFGATIPTGGKYILTWRRKSSYTNSATAYMVVEESADNATFTQNLVKPSTSSKSTFITTTMTTGVPTRYIRLKTNGATDDDFDFDAATRISCTVEICTNGIDDDGDGLVDCADPGCGGAPAANAGGNATICTGGSFTLNATATGGTSPYTFTWNNSLGSGASKTVTPVATTIYIVTVTSAIGCTSTGQATVTVLADPAITTQPASKSICTGTANTLGVVATGGAPGLTYQWQSSLNNALFTDIPGATSSTYTTPALIATTHYRVVVSASGNGCGSVTSNSATVTVLPCIEICDNGADDDLDGLVDCADSNCGGIPVLNAGADATICSGSSTNLSASATGGTAPLVFTWSNGLGTGATKTISPTSTTTYTVTVTSLSGCSATDQVVVNVNPKPTANAGADASICNNFGTTLTATGSGATSPYTFAWSNGLGTGAIQMVMPTTTTTYTVTVTSNNGCNSTDQVTVTVNNCVENCNNNQDDDGDGLIDCTDSDCKPIPNAGTDVSICQGTNAYLSVGVSGGSGPFTYAWSHGLGSGATKTVSPSATTTYSVTVTAAAGCSGVDQVMVTILNCIENCTNGIDDDGDGLVDCADPDCYGVTAPVLANDVYTTCPGMTYSNRVTYNDGNLNNPLFSITANPANGTVTIDWTGKFVYVPNAFECTTDVFTYQVCNQSSGCCNEATVTITLGDNTPPVLTNVPADLTLSCDDEIPSPPTVTGFDNCPGLFMEFDETSSQNFVGACGSYTITRTWTATDFCGNVASDNQVISVQDQTKPEIFQVYTMENGSKLAAGVAQRVTHDWKYIRFPITFKSTPIVLTQVVTNNDASAVVALQRNVGTQGFEVRVKEEESADGNHNIENVSWIAIDPGSDDGNLKWEATTFANVDHLLDTIAFAQTYPAAPVFLSSFMTTRQSDPATLRHQALTNQSVEIFAQEEQSADAEIVRLNENIGYLAIEPNVRLVDAAAEVFGETGKLNLTNAWASVNLARNYTKPVVILGGLTNQDGQPVTVRVRNVSSNKFEVRLQEWNYLDGNHGIENISWMVVEGSIPANVGYYCSGKATSLQTNVNLFALDNCDDLVSFGFNESESQDANGLLTNRTWTAIDDCGNTALISRFDTCVVAAVQVKALLYGALTNNGGSDLMRDNLRTQDLVPVVEPFSELPGFPYVENEITFVTICHNPGQASQQLMEVPLNELQGHLNHGDEMGQCPAPPTSLPPGAAGAQYRTVASGEWTSAATWLAGNVPPVGNVITKSISIEHDVTLSSGDLNLKTGSQLWVSNGSLILGTGNIQLQASSIYMTNSTFETTIGDLYSWTGPCRIEMKDCNVRVGKDFINESGVRKLENVCMTVGHEYRIGYNGVLDTLINTTGTIDWQFRNYQYGKIYVANSKFRITNGDFVNGLNSSLTGNDLMLLVENGGILNTGIWTAPVVQYCVSGSLLVPIQYLLGLNDCKNIANWFTTCTGAPADIASVNNGSNNNSQNNGTNTTGGTGADGPVNASIGLIDPQVLDVAGQEAIVDWMLVELRNPGNAAEVMGYATVIMQRDGDIVNENGDSIIVFPRINEGDYYVSIRHRNHLGIMTNDPVYLTIYDPFLVDFTDYSLPVKGGSLAGRSFNGKRAMWGGDFNEDGRIIYQGPYNDVFHLFSRVLADEGNNTNLANFIVPGYALQDFNLDGMVIYQGPNNDRAPLLYHSILAHGGNAALLANYIVQDLIP
ncbi:MAG: Ig-like domain-containing protein [Bacteroidetes bacterium]|nr:Ig-like domain-containing protein [Bacteroidota bacterium]